MNQDKHWDGVLLLDMYEYLERRLENDPDDYEANALLKRLYDFVEELEKT